MHAMRKLIAALLLLLAAAAPALASNCTPYTFTLTNGSTADANQVMSNFNTIMGCANTNLAKNGANSDISSLSGLTTPLSNAQGGTVVFTGGTSTGTANAQVISTTAPNSFALNAGNIVTWIPGFTNTASVTLSVGGQPATIIDKITASGLAVLTGGEIVSGQSAMAIYDGTEYVLLTSAPKSQPPSITVENSGSGTYATPAGAAYLIVRMIGGGGGGGGSGTGGAVTAGGVGGDTSFNGIVAKGGSGGGLSNAGTAPGAGGAGGSGGTGAAYLRLPGATGGTGAQSNAQYPVPISGIGASSPFGGGGISGLAPGSTGSGGAGAPGVASASLAAGGGGGAGEYVELQINNPAATYSFAVGAGGSAGGAGTSGTAGFAGASAVIVVTAYF